MKYGKLNIKFFFDIQFVISWNKKTSEKTDKLKHVESFVVVFFKKKWCKGSEKK